MKYINFLPLVFFFSFCATKVSTLLDLSGKTFKSKRGESFDGSTLVFPTDTTFVFYGGGPSTFLSKGKYRYSAQNKEIVLWSEKPEGKFLMPKTVDTLWVDLTDKKVKIISRKELVFEKVAYFQE